MKALSNEIITTWHLLALPCPETFRDSKTMLLIESLHGVSETEGC